MTTGKAEWENVRHGFGAPGASILERHPIFRSSGISIEWAVVALTTVTILAIGLIPPELLTALKIHYIRPGGGFYEKIHPATYLVFAAFMLLLVRGGDPIGELERIISTAKLLLVHYFACGLLVFQCLVLKRPFTSVIDTFLLPVVLSVIIWSLVPAQRKPLVVAVHAVIWINIALGLYEFISKHRLVPITVGNLVVTGDWRSTALLGHPLSAAAIVAMYIMCVVLRRGTQTLSLLVAPALIVATCALMVFGGRMALVAVVVVFAGRIVMGAVRLVRGERFGLTTVILVTGGIMLIGATIPIILGTGVFDHMIERFSSDKGSAHARVITMQLLSLFDWKELLLGTVPSQSSAIQSMMGLQYGIENFWVACIVQYGIIQTTCITIGLVCFFAELLRRSVPSARVVVFFIFIVAAGSVSFSSKNITLSAYVALIVLLLPRERARQYLPHRGEPCDDRGFAYAQGITTR